MANPDVQYGLQPWCYHNGAPYNGQANKYYVAAADATALFIGDPVKLAGSADSTGMYPSVIKAAIGDPVVGIMVAVDPALGAGADQAQSTIYRVASTERYIWVCDDPNVIFRVQSDDGGGNLAAADVGLNASFLLGAGSTVTGLSGAELDTSTKNTTNTLDMQILRFLDVPNNAIGANADVLVKLNNHQFVNGTTGV